MAGWKSQLGLILGVAIYTIFGGICFHFLENTSGEIKKSKREYNDFETHLIESNTTVTQEVFDAIVDKAIKAYGKGVFDPESGEAWGIPSAIFFACTVITTIGYGHISPVTTGGRAFCITYALLGIPLVLICLAVLSATLLKLEGKCTKWMDKLKCSPKILGIMRFVFSFACGISTFIVIPSIVFMYTDNWGFGEGIYYSFITLTTVGFGDYVAGQSATRKYVPVIRIFLSVWVYLGLAWVSLLFSIIQDSWKKVGQKVEDKARELEEQHFHPQKKQNKHSTDDLNKQTEPTDSDTGNRTEKYHSGQTA